MQPWTQFYATIGTVAAALLGLLLVVVSTNPSAILGPKSTVLRRLTEQAFQNYLAVMVVAFLALFPGISRATFGLLTLGTTAVWSVWVVIRFCQALIVQVQRRSWIYSLRRHISSLIGFGLMFTSAVRMTLNWGDSFNMFAAATLVLLFSATAVSWALLRTIADQSQ